MFYFYFVYKNTTLLSVDFLLHKNIGFLNLRLPYLCLGLIIG